MLRIAIVGSGFGLYGQLPALNSIKNCEVVAICGKKTERLVNYCQSIALKKIYTNSQEMQENEKLDAIAIAVNPYSQYKIAKKAIEKGIHVFAEKPLAINVTQAKELLNLAKKNKITNAIDFIFPEIDEWKKTKQLLDDKKFGKLMHISANWDFLSFDLRNKVSSWKTDVTEGGGALSYYFSHSLYYLEYYAGEIADVKSIMSYSKENKNGAETGVDLILKFENDVTGYAHISCSCRGLTRHRLLFQCEKGTVLLENDKGVTDNFILKTYNENEQETLFVSDKIIGKEDERVKIVKRIAQRFVEACLNHKQMIPSFKEGLRVQELIEKIRNESIQ